MIRSTIAVAVGAAFAFAAQAQDKPKPPPAWHQGKPPAQAESKLAPHPGKMTETPASEIPISKMKLPKGFKAEIWATGLPGGRAMALTEDGKKVYVGTRGIGRVY
jgi:glucose/arabinose dehydrogenase